MRRMCADCRKLGAGESGVLCIGEISFRGCDDDDVLFCIGNG